MRTRFAAFYGEHLWHLVLNLAGLALLGYVVVVLGPSNLWNPEVWWQSIIVWFLGAVIVHDLVLYPLYAAADRGASALVPARRERRWSISLLNHVRIPCLAVGLLFVLFFPGIIEQGTGSYLRATGQTQEPFLERWLLLSAAIFAASALILGVRVAGAKVISSRAAGRPRAGRRS